VGGQWLAPLAMSDVINLLRDPKSGEHRPLDPSTALHTCVHIWTHTCNPRCVHTPGEYRAVHKTWVDGIDGGQFWKRAVGMSTSKDFDTWDRTRQA